MTPRLAVTCVALSLSVACGASSPTSPTVPPPIVPQFGFAWTGTFAVLSCIETGDAAGVCENGGAARAGATGTYSLTLTQSGAVVSGPFTVGTSAFPPTGATIASDGTLALVGTNTANGITDVARWALTLSGSSLHGTMAITSSDAGGSFTLTAQIVASSHP